MSFKAAQKVQEQAQPNLTLSQAGTKKYRYWRYRVMYALIIGYAAFYLVRLNFSMAIPGMMETFGFSKVDFGTILSLSSLVYGAGRFVNGYFCDRSNARFFMTIGLVGTALINIFMGFGSSLIFFGLLWTVNSCFQSMGSPAISRLLSHWYSAKELGTKWGIWNSSHQIGGAAIFILAGYLIEHFGWQSAFFVPAGLALVLALFLFDRLRDTPQSLGLPPVEVYSKIPHIIDSETTRLSSKEAFQSVLKNKYLWAVALGNMFLYIVRIGVFNWAPTFLKEMKGSSLLASGWQSAGFEIAGLVGGLAAGWMSDKVFHGRRGPVSALYMLALAGSLIAFWLAPAGYTWLNAVLMFGMGFMVYGPQVLACVAAADFATKQTVGLANGFAGVMGYLGGAISGLGIGYIAEFYGWDGGFFFFIASALLGTFFFALTWKKRAEVLEKTRKSIA